jgi:hypothetical protein
MASRYPYVLYLTQMISRMLDITVGDQATGHQDKKKEENNKRRSDLKCL